MNLPYSYYQSHSPSRVKGLDEKLSFNECQSSPRPGTVVSDLKIINIKIPCSKTVVFSTDNEFKFCFSFKTEKLGGIALPEIK